MQALPNYVDEYNTSCAAPPFQAQKTKRRSGREGNRDSNAPESVYIYLGRPRAGT